MLTRPLDPKDRLDIELTADPHARCAGRVMDPVRTVLLKSASLNLTPCRSYASGPLFTRLGIWAVLPQLSSAESNFMALTPVGS